MKHQPGHTSTDGRKQADPDRLALTDPLTSGRAVVRELDRSDADLVANAAQDVEFVQGTLAVPGSREEAVAMLAEFEQLRRLGVANLYGVFTPVGHTLAGVISLRVGDDLVAEGACWSRNDKGTRKVTAEGLHLLTGYAHSALGIVRLWVALDPLDPFTRRLAIHGGWTQEVLNDGTGKTRFSSIG